MSEELRMYSTIGGELPKFVEDGIAKCFVEYKQYLALEKAYKEAMGKAHDDR